MNTLFVNIIVIGSCFTAIILTVLICYSIIKVSSNQIALNKIEAKGEYLLNSLKSLYNSLFISIHKEMKENYDYELSLNSPEVVNRMRESILEKLSCINREYNLYQFENKAVPLSCKIIVINQLINGLIGVYEEYYMFSDTAIPVHEIGISLN